MLIVFSSLYFVCSRISFLFNLWYWQVVVWEDVGVYQKHIYRIGREIDPPWLRDWNIKSWILFLEIILFPEEYYLFVRRRTDIQSNDAFPQVSRIHDYLSLGKRNKFFDHHGHSRTFMWLPRNPCLLFFRRISCFAS